MSGDRLDPPNHPARSVPSEVARGQLRLVSTLPAPERGKLARVVPVLAPKPQLRLARDTDPQVRSDLARQKHLLPSTQLALCEQRGRTRDHGSLLSHLVRNPFLTPETARLAAGTGVPVVLSELTKNPAAPADVLSGLVGHSVEHVSRSALANPNNPAALERSRYGTVREYESVVGGNLHADPQLLRDLALSGNPWALEAVAGNPAAPLDVLELLALSHSDGVRQQLARNRAISRFCVEMLLDPVGAAGPVSSGVLLRLAGNPSTPADLLEVLDEDNGASAQVQGALALNPSSPLTLLERYLVSGGVTVQKKVVRNVRAHLLAPVTPVRVLDPLLLAAYCITSPEWETIRPLAENWQGTLGELLETCDILA